MQGLRKSKAGSEHSKVVANDHTATASVSKQDADDEEETTSVYTNSPNHTTLLANANEDYDDMYNEDLPHKIGSSDIIGADTTTTTTTTSKPQSITRGKSHPPSQTEQLHQQQQLTYPMDRYAETRDLVKKFIADIWNRGELDLIPDVCSPSLRFNGNTGTLVMVAHACLLHCRCNSATITTVHVSYSETSHANVSLHRF